jgi:hypothetical protein
MAKTREYFIPGIYNKLCVKLVTGKWLQRLAKAAKDEYVHAYYIHEDCEVYVVKETTAHVKEQHLYHEIAHHILETLSTIQDEEAKCDVLGAYLMRLGKEYVRIEGKLKDE